MTEDPRNGLPSASSVYRVVACPGSLNSEIGLPELPPQKVTEEGSDIHEAIETGDTSGLSGDAEQIANKLRAMESQALDAWLGSIPNYDGTVPDRHTEERLWIRDRKTLELVASAQLDVFYVFGEYAIIIDNKTGFIDAPPADKNWQLSTQMVALWHEFPQVQHFRVCIAQSRLSSKLDAADYDNDVVHSERELTHALWLSKSPHAQRRPGTHCLYCKAKGVCPEASAYSLVTQQQMGLATGDKLAILSAVNHLTPDKLALVFTRSKIANLIFDAVEAKLKAMTLEQLAPLGLMLKPGAVQKKVNNNALALEKIGGTLTNGELMECMKLSVAKLAEVYAVKKSISKKAAQEYAIALLGDAVEQTQNAASLAVLK